MRLSRGLLLTAGMLGVVAIAVTAVVVPRERPRRLPPVSTRGDGTRVGEPVKLAERLYLIPGGGCNTAVFITATGVVVVDPKFASSWPDLVTRIRGLTDKPVTHAISTHFHEDHAGASRIVPAGVQVVATEQALGEMARYGFLSDGSDGHLPTTRSYTDRLTLFEGPDRVTLVAPGPAHTGGDTLVVFHEARVMHAGDMFPDKVPPIVHIEGGGDGVRFAAALAATVASVSDVELVITGHGPVMRWADFAGFADFVQMLVDYVRAEMRFMRDKNQVFRAIPVPARYADYDLGRMYETLDEIDRSIRPRWQRVF